MTSSPTNAMKTPSTSSRRSGDSFASGLLSFGSRMLRLGFGSDRRRRGAAARVDLRAAPRADEDLDFETPVRDGRLAVLGMG